MSQCRRGGSPIRRAGDDKQLRRQLNYMVVAPATRAEGAGVMVDLALGASWRREVRDESLVGTIISE